VVDDAGQGAGRGEVEDRLVDPHERRHMEAAQKQKQY
jgi:hypothetical protein